MYINITGYDVTESRDPERTNQCAELAWAYKRWSFEQTTQRPCVSQTDNIWSSHLFGAPHDIIMWKLGFHGHSQ